MNTTDLNECAVCAEKCNNSTHKAILCEYGDCNFTACKACVRTYLLNTTTDPHCMMCKKVWTEQFIVLHLNRSFIINDYKIHRRTLLLDREISKLPETMHAAERYKRIDVQKTIAADINEKIKEARKVLDNLITQWNDANRVLHLLKSGKDVVQEVERKKFIMPCPNNDCRGYLSSQYKCELCTLYTCVNCHELIGYQKDDPHTCKEENVQSAELIKKETKPCPTCGTRISKISGCDQMWCPECHKAFSWRTGLVDNGVIHNPHFYQYQQENAGANAAPRTPGHVVCGGLCEWYIFNNNILRKIKSGTLMPDTGVELRTYLADIHRFIAHITRVDLFAIRAKVRDLSDFEEMRCKYILQQISKEELAKTIYRNDALRKKLTEMLHLYELLSVVGTEFFAKILESVNVQEAFITEVITQCEEYDRLRDYCNKQFKAISLTYNQTVPCVSKNFVITSKKYTFTVKKVKKTAEANEIGANEIGANEIANEIAENVIIN
uniref:RING-type domain-containing protein n=1 Tax=viral metagenome TaxID=1070528 RepID=A0A6C0IIX7_9ZZZZ